MNHPAIRGEEIYETTAVPVDEHSQLSSFRENVIDKINSGVTLDHRDELIATNVHPNEAFEVFNGHLFLTQKQEYSLVDSIERRIESPLQKLTRLRSELNDLKVDLDQMVAIEKEHESNSIWSVLQNEANRLSQQTQEIAQHKGLQKVSHEIVAADKVMDGLIADLKNVSNANRINNSATVSSELIQSTTNSLPSDLERRVFQLETILGISSNVMDLEALNTKSSLLGSFPLVDVISKLEQKVSLLDVSNLEGLKAKANALRLELELTSKAKMSSTESRVVESVRKVEELYEKVQKVESIGDNLPSLVMRLKTLEGIHLASSTFATRLSTLEEDTRKVAGDLKSNREVLTSLKENLKENLSIMQQNMKQMDQKIAGLTGAKK